MPTNKTRTLITLTLDELENLRREAAEKETSLNNSLRSKIGLPELKHGGKREKKKEKPHGRRKNREAI